MIRNIDDRLHARLKQDAAAHGRSMEEEVRCILRDRLAIAPSHEAMNWVDAIRALVEPFGGIEFPAIERPNVPEPPDFAGPEWESNE